MLPYHIIPYRLIFCQFILHHIITHHHPSPIPSTSESSWAAPVWCPCSTWNGSQLQLGPQLYHWLRISKSSWMDLTRLNPFECLIQTDFNSLNPQTLGAHHLNLCQSNCLDSGEVGEICLNESQQQRRGDCLTMGCKPPMYNRRWKNSLKQPQQYGHCTMNMLDGWRSHQTTGLNSTLY